MVPFDFAKHGAEIDEGAVQWWKEFAMPMRSMSLAGGCEPLTSGAFP